MEKIQLLTKLEMKGIVGAASAQQTQFSVATDVPYLTSFYGFFGADYRDLESHGDAYPDQCCE